MVKNPPSNAGDVCLIPSQGTKIPHAEGQLSPCATTTELACLKERACMLQTTEPMCSGAHVPQLERENPHATTREKPVRGNDETLCQKEKILHASVKIPHATTETQHSQKNKIK